MKTIKNKKIVKRMRLKKQVRSLVAGTSTKPRLSVFKSNMHIYAQLIDDSSRSTLASASDMKITTGSKGDRAQKVGEAIANAAKNAKIEEVVFDRNGFKYTGRIKLLAEAARGAGLKF